MADPLRAPAARQEPDLEPLPVEGRVGALRRLTDRMENRLEALKRRLLRPECEPSIRIVPALGFGSASSLYLQGRVLRDPPDYIAGPGDSRLRNFINTWKRFETDEVAAARLRARFRDTTAEVSCDDAGYFQFVLEPREGTTAEWGLWHEVGIELLDPSCEPKVEAKGSVLIPPANARFAIVSDLDDTVIATGVTRRRLAAARTALGNAFTRLPFPGVAAFYDALHEETEGTDGALRGPNPIFFVSSSPWNFHDQLLHFLELQSIPRGPLLLREYGLDRGRPTRLTGPEHKLAAIRSLFALYPDLPFLLIGDSGERDPETYTQLIREHPGRVLAAYIRSVHNRAAREESVRALAAEADRLGTPMVVVRDTLAAALHAAERGWIRAERLADIRLEKVKDESGPATGS